MKKTSEDEAINSWLRELLLSIHIRNGGERIEVDLTQPILGGELKLDSLDVAEVAIEIERRGHRSPFARNSVPRTWIDVCAG